MFRICKKEFNLLNVIYFFFFLVASELNVAGDRLKCTQGGVCSHLELNSLRFFLIGDIGG